MIKYSIIIPILNVEKYLSKCLDSVLNQTFSNFECLLICGDSSDKSTSIAKEYVKKDNRFKYYHRSNTGLSIARNVGIEKAKGEYLLFLDSDDYYESNLLEILSKYKEDVIRFQVREINKEKMTEWNEKTVNGSGLEAFKSIINFHYVENAWAYTYKRDYWINNNFKFMDNCIAEDYGLIPLVIAKANTLRAISFIGYNYLQRDNSLMNEANYSKRIKKMEDMIKQAKYLYKEFKDINNNDDFMLFINNSLIYYSTTLEKKDYKKYNKELKEMKVFDSLPIDNLKHRIKKWIIKNNSYFFYHFLLRYL